MPERLEQLQAKALSLSSNDRPLRNASLAVTRDSLLYCAYQRIRASEHGMAQRLLQNSVLKGVPQAAQMLETARLLSGGAVHERSETPVVSAARIAIEALVVSPTSHSEPKLNGIVDELRTAASHPWSEAITELGDVVRTLGAAIEAVRVFETPRIEERQRPSWLHWVMLRVQLSGPEAGRHAITVARLRTTPPILAWMLDCWYTLYGQPIGEMADLQTMRPTWQAGLVDSNLSRLLTEMRLRTAGRGPIETYAVNTPAGRPWQFVPEIEQLVADDIWIETMFGIGRWQIRRREYAEAVESFGKILRELENKPLLVERFWKPAVIYWLGVAEASRGEHVKAVEAFRRVLRTAKADDARGQLALIAIRSRDFGGAKSLLDQISQITPGVLYARALLSARRGEIRHALELLASFERHCLDPDHPYLLASRRLEAVLYERTGMRVRAISCYSDLLNTSANDPVTRGRALRARVLKTYDDMTLGSRTPAEVSQSSSNRPPGALPKWSESYRRLERLLVCTPREIVDVANEIFEASAVSGLASPWLALVVRRLASTAQAALIPEFLAQSVGATPEVLAKGAAEARGSHPEAAVPALRERVRLDVLRKAISATVLSDAAGSVRFACAFLVWDVLRNGWRYIPADVEQDPLEMRGSVTAFLETATERLRLLGLACSDDAPLLETSELVTKALAQADAGAGTGGRDIAQPLAHPLRLDEETRPAESVRQLLSFHGRDTSALDADQSRLYEALKSLDEGAWDLFAGLYVGFESQLCSLPMTAADLWMAWCQGRLLSDGWRQAIESTLPDCLADMSHPGVRRLTALANARGAAAMISSGDARRALELVRQSLSVLALGDRPDGGL